MRRRVGLSAGPWWRDATLVGDHPAASVHRPAPHVCSPTTPSTFRPPLLLHTSHRSGSEGPEVPVDYEEGSGGSAGSFTAV